MNRSQGSQPPIRALPTRAPQHGSSPRKSLEDHRVWPPPLTSAEAEAQRRRPARGHPANRGPSCRVRGSGARSGSPGPPGSRTFPLRWNPKTKTKLSLLSPPLLLFHPLSPLGFPCPSPFPVTSASFHLLVHVPSPWSSSPPVLTPPSVLGCWCPGSEQALTLVSR